MRLLYLGMLIVVAVIYTATMPPESLSVWSLAKYLIPATGIGLLFVLAKGVLGEGLTTHIGALLLVIGAMAFVSISLSSTGWFVHVKTAADLVGNVSSMVNGSIPINLGIP